MFGTERRREGALAAAAVGQQELKAAVELPESPESATRQGPAAVDWSALVEQVKSGDDAGMEALYKLFSKGIRYYLYRHLGPQELEDKVHDTFLIVVKAIKHGDVREPDRLMGFIHTVVRRQIAAYVQAIVRDRREEVEFDIGIPVVDRTPDPEQVAMIHEKASLMKIALRALSERDRQILVRFYLKEEPHEQVCQEMMITETQFRLTKSRAKAKFAQLARKKLMAGGLLSSAMAKTRSRRAATL